MKFNFFHLAPYPYLPEGWDDEHSSMSLTFPNGNFDPAIGHELYHRYLDELEYAESVGFDGIAVNEHHQTAYGIMPSPNIMAAALARRTTRAKIMVLGNAIPIRGNPLRVAEEIAMLDHLTSGRLVSGFVRGIGWEYFAHSISPSRSRSRFDEAHDLIIKAWTSREPFQWIGENYEYRYVNLWPRPLQDPHPPVVMAGGGSTETMRWCAQHRHTFMSVISKTENIKRWFDTFRHFAREEFGYEPEPEQLGWVAPVYVGETDKKALAEAREPIEWYFRKSLAQPPGAGLPPGYMTMDSLRSAFAAGGGLPSFDKPIEELIEGGYIIVGSPSTVAERIHELSETLGFGQLGCNIPVGTLSAQQTRESTDAFAKEVIPLFREKEAASAPAPAPDAALVDG
jgi:alkanesulfonate monooxygenase SsuD/methylene tetrahydromethanopterin reductase-like flavin-dependent oxidoreductase (luciferase family)